MLGEGNDVDALHDASKLVEAILKRRSAAIRVRGELADGIRMKRKCGGVVTPHRINVLVDYLNHLFAHCILGSFSNSNGGLERIHKDTVCEFRKF
jgi:hypothetical protein